MEIFESKFKIKSYHHLNRYFKLISSYRDNTRLYDYEMRKCDISKLTNEGKYQYKGWYARLAKDIKS